MKTPEHATMAVNILRVFDDATREQQQEGNTWYADAHTWAIDMSRAHFATVEQVSGIIAALSPLTPWGRNLELAELVLEDSGDRIPTLQANAVKARRILEGEDPWAVLTSQKVRAFFEGILYDGNTDVVCIDRHAMSVAYGFAVPKAEQGMTPRQYAAYAAAYVDAAATIGIPAAKLQAITWVVWRKTRGIA